MARNFYIYQRRDEQGVDSLNTVNKTAKKKNNRSGISFYPKVILYYFMWNKINFLNFSVQFRTLWCTNGKLFWYTCIPCANPTTPLKQITNVKSCTHNKTPINYCFLLLALNWRNFIKKCDERCPHSRATRLLLQALPRKLIFLKSCNLIHLTPIKKIVF